jgi:chromosome segregation ATPase
MDIEKTLDALQDENARLRAECDGYTTELRQLRSLYGDRAEELKFLRRELQDADARNGKLAVERDALKAWRDAVPVNEIHEVSVSFRPASSLEQIADERISEWLATLDGAQ